MTTATLLLPPEVVPASQTEELFSWVAEAEERSVESEIDELAAVWRADTLYSSNLERITSHPSYLRIIAIGQRGLSTLLRMLERDPDLWFPALEAITGENPVAPEHRGDIDAMAGDWLRWGRAHQVI